MRIKRLRLVNWCQHRELDAEFGDVTNVRGPNGSGKTNLVGGLVYAFTGEYLADGRKEENVSTGVGEKDPSSVTVWFERAGTDYELHRSLRPAKQYLKGGPELLTRAPAIRDHLREVLGVDEKIVLNYVFVPQWGMFNFLTAKDEDRARVFGQLFGTDRAVRLRDLLQKPPLPDAEPFVSAVGLESALFAQKSRREELAADVSNRRAWLAGMSERIEQSKELLTAHQKRASVSTTIDYLHRQVVFLSNLVSDGQAALSDALVQVSQTEAVAQNMAEAATTAGRMVTAHRDYEIWLSKVGPARSALATWSRELENAAGPPVPDDYVAPADRDALTAEMAEAQASLARHHHLLKHCDPVKGVSACPACGTSVADPNVAARIETARTEIPVLEEAVRAVRQAIHRSAVHDEAVRVGDRRRAEAAARVAAAEATLQTLGETPRPELSKSEALSILAEYDNAVSLVVQQRDRLARLRATAELDAKRLSDARRELADKEVQLGPEPAGPPSEAILKFLNECDAVGLQLQRSTASLEEVDKNVAHLERQLETHRKAARKAEARGRIAAHLEEVRDLFHRDRLPKTVSQYYLNKLKAEVNANLADLDVPFRPFQVDSVEDLRFTVRFVDTAETCRAERLSGGQKVLLALAFRLAVHSMFASELGLLCLDEPTAGLDEDNLANIGVALGKLREVSRARGLQVVLITHEKGLDNLSDRVVDLASAP